MNLVLAVLAALLASAFLLAGATWAGARQIERRYPPSGDFAAIDGVAVHHVHIPPGERADLPPVIFIHGASGNLMDQMVPAKPLLDRRAELLFLDRPGHGWSERGKANDTPAGQAATIAKLMHRRGIESAIIVGHSFGAAVAAAFALERPEMTRGLVFLSAATHPWPGGATSWYYRVAANRLVGPLFCHTLAWPGGMLRLVGASRNVFSPNAMPPDYAAKAAIPLVLRPAAFHANAIDVEGLYRFVHEASARYRDIDTPTVIITGNRDVVVYEDIHSGGLARDIPGARLITIDNLGHKPDWVAPDLVVAAIETVAGVSGHAALAEKAREVEARIGGDTADRANDADRTSPAEGVLTQ